MLIDVLEADDPTPGQDAQFFRRTAGSYERYGDFVLLDLGSYGIELLTDGTDCYAPLQTLSDFMLSYNYVNVFYNGETVVFAQYGTLGSVDELTELGLLL